MIEAVRRMQASANGLIRFFPGEVEGLAAGEDIRRNCNRLVAAASG